jgi:hypothetical protein
MLSIWFMFDNFTFEKITARDRDGLIRQAKKCFAEDGCGALFVRDEFEASLESLTLMGRQLERGRYGVLDGDIGAWADKILEEHSFRKMMCA